MDRGRPAYFLHSFSPGSSSSLGSPFSVELTFRFTVQDPDAGGIADRPGDMADVFHTLFGVAGLSLLGYPGLIDLDPVYCMPAELIEKMGLKKRWSALPRKA